MTFSIFLTIASQPNAKQERQEIITDDVVPRYTFLGFAYGCSDTNEPTGPHNALNLNLCTNIGNSKLSNGHQSVSISKYKHSYTFMKVYKSITQKRLLQRSLHRKN